MNGVKKFLKFIALWFVFFWVFALFWSAVAGDDATEIIDSTSSTNVQYDGSSNVNGESENINTDETISVTTSVEAMKEKYFLYAILCGLATAYLIIIVGDNNKAQHLKARIPALSNDVISLDERRIHQIDQANRVLDKYLNHKNSTSVTTEKNSEDKVDEVIFHKVKNEKEFRSVVETHPTLSGNDAINSLMNQIKEVEMLLSNKKEELNNVIADYNGMINSFPLSLLKKISKLEDYETPRILSTVTNEVTDEDLGI